jgi:NADH-quinone oxidoreductase subunit L
MLTLVLGDNLLLLFVGWEGVGLCSYALIGFWYTEPANARAGSKAFIVNRIGDFGFVLGMFLLFWTLADAGQATLTFRELASARRCSKARTFLGVGVATAGHAAAVRRRHRQVGADPPLRLAARRHGRSDARQRLIHAATMVTAGVYMIGRMSFLFVHGAVRRSRSIASVGAATAFFAATIGLAQNDIKKVLAYSTVSQLGYMFLAMGVGAYAAGDLPPDDARLLQGLPLPRLGQRHPRHAPRAGHAQDGRAQEVDAVTYWTFLISTLAIAGFPPHVGVLLQGRDPGKAFERTAASGSGRSPCAAAALTAFYMFRQVFMTFHGEFRGPTAHGEEHGGHGAPAHLHESPRGDDRAAGHPGGAGDVAGFSGCRTLFGPGASRLRALAERRPVFSARPRRARRITTRCGLESASMADHGGDARRGAGSSSSPT